jgi:hypothetical protein
MIKFILLKKIGIFILHLLQFIQLGLDFIFFRWRLKHVSAKDAVNQYYKIMNEGFMSKYLKQDKLPFGEKIVLITQQEHFEGKEKVIELLKQLILTINGFEIKKQFIDETGGCTLLNYVTLKNQIPLDVAEWIDVTNGKIKAIHLYYDPTKLQ